MRRGAAAGGRGAPVRQRPLLLHGRRALGPAPTSPIEEKRAPGGVVLADDALAPEAWSGAPRVRVRRCSRSATSAAPPRMPTVEGTAPTLRSPRGSRAVPLVENVAGIHRFPGQHAGNEPGVGGPAILQATPAICCWTSTTCTSTRPTSGSTRPNRRATARLSRIRAIDLAGGTHVGGRVMDDHKHAVPYPVFELRPPSDAMRRGQLTVMLEREAIPRRCQRCSTKWIAPARRSRADAKARL